jgi:hypothetical protein
VKVQDTTAPAVSVSIVPVIGGANHNDAAHTVQWTCTDAVGVVSQTATLNGVAVVNGQFVLLEHDDSGVSSSRLNGQGVLVLESSSFVLAISCADAAGNAGMASVTRVLPQQNNQSNG